MSKNQIFRQAALEQLSTPEQLDQLMVVTTPRGWLALLAIGLIIGVTLVWSLLGSIPTRINGQGVVLVAGGVNNIVALSEGQVSRVYVDVGDVIRKGKVVARIDETQAGARGRVTSPYSGQVVEIQAGVGTFVSQGTPIISLEPLAPQNDTPDAVVYVSAAEGKRIQPGMRVQVSPSTFRKEEFGYILGQVHAVSSFPVTSQGMMQTLGSQELVNAFTSIEAPLEVQITLERRPDHPTGFQWSSRGPDDLLENGTICTAQIITEQRQPVSLVIPLLRRQMGL